MTSFLTARLRVRRLTLASMVIGVATVVAGCIAGAEVPTDPAPSAS